MLISPSADALKQGQLVLLVVKTLKFLIEFPIENFKSGSTLLKNIALLVRYTFFPAFWQREILQIIVVKKFGSFEL